MFVDVSDFRNGLKIVHDGQPFVVVEFQHVKPGKGNAFTRTRIRNLISGRTLDPTFKSGEKVEAADIEQKVMQYLFAEGDHLTFMDNSSYEQILLDRSLIGDQALWLKENTDCDILFWNGKAIGVELPAHTVLKITECEPGVRGDTATNATKPAKLETGAEVQVPLFINEGEWIKVDTREGTYIERAQAPA